MAGTLVVGTKQLTAKLNEMIQAVSPAGQRKALMQGGKVLERYMSLNVRSQHLIDTGNLRASITAEPDSDSSVTVGPRNVIYAAIHEFGGTISAKSTKFLAIPLTKAARQAGSPRSYGDALKFRGNANGGVLVDDSGNALYALKTSVTIPAKPYVRPAIDEHGDEAIEAIGNGLITLIQQAAGG